MFNEVYSKKIYLYIQEYTKENGYPPTYREIGIKMGGLSTSSVSKYIDILESDGLIRKERGKKSRTLVMIKKNYKKARVNANVLDILNEDKLKIKEKMNCSNDLDFYILNGISEYIDKLIEKLK